MNCPVDGTELRMAERQGVEIDYCPKCRGIWQDRGELDKILERATPQAEVREWDDEGQRDRRRRRGWFVDLFDFD